MSFITSGLKYLLFVFFAVSYKSAPLMYYVRFYSVVIQNLILPKPFRKQYRFKSPFQVDSIKTYNSPMECDFYFHKSNSTYLSELDIARTQLMTRVFQKLFLTYPTESKTWPYLPVANIFCNFKKEIKPFASYRVDSRIHSWDDKWLFILSKFIIYGKNGEDVVSATALTKYVFKDGKKTIKPVDALKFVGLWSEDYEAESAKNLKLVDYFINTNDLDVFEM